MQAALAHANVVGCMGVNLPFFLWPQTHPRAQNAPTRAHWRSVRSLHKWRRLLTGQSNAFTIASHLAGRIGKHVAARVSAPFERIFGLKTPSSEARRLAAGLARKGVQTALVYGPMDAGLDELALHFGPDGSELAKLAQTTATVVDKLDHALFSSAARDAAMSQFEQFLRERMKLTCRGDQRGALASR